MFRNRLHERQAYKAIFVRRLSIEELDASISGLDAAKENAERLATEVVELITAARKSEETHAHA